MVSWGWMKMESHLGTSSATSTSWGLRYLQCFTWFNKQNLVTLYCVKFHAQFKVWRWLQDWNHTVSVMWLFFFIVFFVCFLDRNQLQDIHRQLEYSDRNLAQDVSAANVNLSAHAQRKHLLSFPFLLNMSDSSHLLRVCYDRAPKHRLALTFILSALWHGVYPGYYFTFITAIPITMAARAVSTLPPPEIQINTSVYNW